MARYDLALRRLGIRAKPLPPLEVIEKLYMDTDEGRIFLARLDSLIDAVRMANADLLMVGFPMLEQIRARRGLPQAKFSAIAANKNTLFVDLYDAFLSSSDKGQVVFEADGLHPNGAGHFIAAREILGALREHGLLREQMP